MRIKGVARAALAALVLVGCKGSAKRSEPEPLTGPSPSQAANDALLALAPSGTTTAVVASARALDLAEATRTRLRAMAKSDPVVQQIADQLDDMLSEELSLAPGASRTTIGLAADRGLARFQLGDRSLSIWPVADRAAFVRAFHGQRGAGAGADGVDTATIAGEEVRCREVKGVYACATDEHDLDRLGTGSLAGRPARAGGRGDVELVNVEAEDRDPSIQEAVVTFALEPGQVIVRAKLAGTLPTEVKAQARERITVPAATASGFSGLAVSPAAFETLRAVDPDLGPVIADLDGRVTMTAPSGVTDMDVRVGFRHTDAIRALLAGCDRLPLPDTITVRRDGDACVVSAAAPIPFTATVWLDGNTLRIAHARAPLAAATGPGPGPIGRELAAQPWNFVVWGRGSSLAVPGAGQWGGADGAVFVRTLTYLSELGIGTRIDDDGMTVVVAARTVFANPPAVVDALPPLVARAIAGEDISADVRALVATNPTSPFADDVKAGHIGLMVATEALGVLTAVAIPKFLDSMHTGKRSEAELNLDAIGKAADAEYTENAQFPVGTAALTPATSCCQQPGKRCEPVASDWNGVAVWDALGFEMTEPSYFQYAYQSDGRTFVATAVGDLDCDGVSVTYELDGTIDADGAAHQTLHKPAGPD